MTSDPAARDGDISSGQGKQPEGAPTTDERAAHMIPGNQPSGGQASQPEAAMPTPALPVDEPAVEPQEPKLEDTASGFDNVPAGEVGGQPGESADAANGLITPPAGNAASGGGGDGW